MPAARELGIGVVPYRVLADGLLTGTLTREPTGHLVAPRMQGENLKHNLETVGLLKRMATEKGYAPAQLAVAWLLSRGDDIVPQIGMTSPTRLAEHLAAVDIRFTSDELGTLDRVFAPGATRGDRYPALVMQYVAS